MIQCPNCGCMNDDKSKFCSDCGKSLSGSIYDFQLGKSQQQNNDSRVNNDPRRIDETQHVSNQPQVNNQRPTNQSRGSNDPRRIDEREHVYKNPRVDNQPQVNNQQRVNNIPQTNNQQQNTNYNNNNSNGSIFDKISGLSLPVKIIGFIVICCIGILVISSLMGGIGDKGSLTSDNSYNSNSNSYDNVFDSFSKSDCKEISYKELNKNPDRYYGDNIKLQGRIMQISEGNPNGNYMLMYVNDDYNQLAYVEYYNNTNFVEDDWVTVYGVCAGSYTYKTTSGGTYTVPSMFGAILQ